MSRLTERQMHPIRVPAEISDDLEALILASGREVNDYLEALNQEFKAQDQAVHRLYDECDNFLIVTANASGGIIKGDNSSKIWVKICTLEEVLNFVGSLGDPPFNSVVDIHINRHCPAEETRPGIVLH